MNLSDSKCCTNCNSLVSQSEQILWSLIGAALSMCVFAVQALALQFNYFIEVSITAHVPAVPFQWPLRTSNTLMYVTTIAVCDYQALT